MKKNKNKIKASVGNKILKGIAGTLTVIWIFLLFFPIYWMIASSFKDESAQYADPPQFAITPPNAYTLQIDYTSEEADAAGKDGMFLDANILLWRAYEVSGSNIGKVSVLATIDGEPNTEYILTKSSRENHRTKMWSKSILLNSDIERVINYIDEKGFVEVNENKVTYPKKAHESQYTKQMLEKFEGDTDIVGTLSSCTYYGSWANLFENYKIAWAYPETFGMEGGLVKAIGNTVFIAIVQFALTNLVTSLAAYALSKLLPRWLKGKMLIFIMMSGMIPATLTLIPQYQVVQGLGLHNSLWAVILPNIAAFGSTLLYKGTYDAFPDSILEAARIDGANEIQIYTLFAIPSSISLLGYNAITTFASVWGTYMWPSMVLRDESKYTIGQVVYTLLNGSGGGGDYATNLALGFLVSIPTLVIYALFQKTLNYGFDYSGLKG